MDVSVRMVVGGSADSGEVLVTRAVADVPAVLEVTAMVLGDFFFF